MLLQSVQFIKKNSLLVLVGGKKQEIESLKKTSNILDDRDILMVGQKPHNLIPYYIKAADVLVLPNKAGDVWSEYYTSPLKLFEYMAGRRPIVASNLPSIREVLDKESAMLFEANNPVDLAEKINLLIDNPDLGRQLADKAFQKVTNYTWDKRAQIIIKFILG
ncbi:MAG: glycosyltransferase family 4 protein [Candidatus Magasanikbacteria bacterium]|nr:glycosyltransferase family 4 protein [Candidatus Magasanikbacteria bacterium]